MNNTEQTNIFFCTVNAFDFNEGKENRTENTSKTLIEYLHPLFFFLHYCISFLAESRDNVFRIMKLLLPVFFQVVDMRWGVRDEMTDEHMTTALCMNELRKVASKGCRLVQASADYSAYSCRLVQASAG